MMCSKAALLYYATIAVPSGIVGVSSFTTPSQQGATTISTRPLAYPSSHSRVPLFAEADENASTEAALPPTSLPPPSESSSTTPDNDNNDDITASLGSMPSSPATAALFINQQTKRILIEELGYKRAEVERLRPELASPIISKRISRPAKGVPEEWMVAQDQTSSAMLERLENESKYPLKFPLLGISLILFGKGFSDAAITLIKITTDFPGASLTDQFMGVPVLAIDAVCIVLGAALASWTWQSMRD